jgi:hypothetical protein
VSLQLFALNDVEWFARELSVLLLCLLRELSELHRQLVGVAPRWSGTYTRWLKSLCAPDDYSTKTRKNILNSFSHHDNVVRIRDNRWR